MNRAADVENVERIQNQLPKGKDMFKMGFATKSDMGVAQGYLKNVFSVNMCLFPNLITIGS